MSKPRSKTNVNQTYLLRNETRGGRHVQGCPAQNDEPAAHEDERTRGDGKDAREELLRSRDGGEGEEDEEENLEYVSHKDFIHEFLY